MTESSVPICCCRLSPNSTISRSFLFTYFLCTAASSCTLCHVAYVYRMLLIFCVLERLDQRGSAQIGNAGESLSGRAEPNGVSVTPRSANARKLNRTETMWPRSGCRSGVTERPGCMKEDQGLERRPQLFKWGQR